MVLTNRGQGLQEVEMAGRDKVAEAEEGVLVGQDLAVGAADEGLVVVAGSEPSDQCL